MSSTSTSAQSIDYRVLILLSDSAQFLTLDLSCGSKLPRVSVPPNSRQARELQRRIKEAWGLSILILDFIIQASRNQNYAVAELLDPHVRTGFKSLPLDDISRFEIADEPRSHLASLIGGGQRSPFSQVGWIDEAIIWFEDVTTRRLSSKDKIEQYNAGGAFTLLRLPTTEEETFWLKATGEPNSHELPVTLLLSDLCGEYIPAILGTKPEWNAWIMSDGKQKLNTIPTESMMLCDFLGVAIDAMARLQMKTKGHELELLAAGAFDQRTNALMANSESLFAYLEKVSRLEKSAEGPSTMTGRLREIRDIFEHVYARVSVLDLPTTIVHGDLSAGNILFDRGRCKFIDWSEAYVGNPLTALQHLLLLNQIDSGQIRNLTNAKLKERYRNVVLESCSEDAIKQGFVYMPFLALVSTLYGRGDWLTRSDRDHPRRQAYLRNLIRHLDRAASDPRLLTFLKA